MADSPLNVVRDALQVYADRSIFRSFHETKTSKGLPSFKFVWMLDHPMELTVDTTKHELQFRRLLPNIPAGSTMNAEVREYLSQQQDPKLPTHRRVDRRKADLICTSRGGFISISLQVKKNQYAYGVNRIVNLVHGLFCELPALWPEYLVENFNVPEE